MTTGWLVLFYLLEILKWLVILRAVASWFVAPDTDHPLLELLRRVTEPVLRPVRAILPELGGVDLSPLLVFALIVLLQGVIGRFGF